MYGTVAVPRTVLYPAVFVSYTVYGTGYSYGEKQTTYCSLMKMAYGSTHWNYPCHLSPLPPLPRYARFPSVYICATIPYDIISNLVAIRVHFCHGSVPGLCTNGSRIPPPTLPCHSAAILAFCLNLAISLHWCQGYGSGKGSVFM